MTTTYRLTEKDIKEIISKYMKQEFNLKNPNVNLKQEIQQGYGFQEGEKYEVIIATVAEL